MANIGRPVVEILSGSIPKRKRSASEDAQDVGTARVEDAKRWRPNPVDGVPEMASKAESPAETKEAVVDSSMIRDAIESQFSLEILMKHNELRLINQELAKCQAALEQLRRCHLIPYPTTQPTPESMGNVSTGTGQSLKQSDHVPAWAPPYGVTDGPYTRHYAKWLIPDPKFDGIQDQWYQGFDPSRGGKTVPEGRSTRNSFADSNSAASKARAQRGSSGQKLQALSNGYPVAKEKAGPCVLKRAEDGQMVKLVCNDCQRENFSSTQGFINHCRIAHRKEYKSHEEAAIACGQPIDLDEAGGVVGEEKTAPPSNGLVHPLVQNAPADRQAYVDLLSRIDASMALFKQGKLPGVESIPSLPKSRPLKADSQTPTAMSPHQNLVPSPDTPFLSRLMRNRGLCGNLAEIVGEAKQHVDFDAYSPDTESDDGESHPEPRLGGFDGACDSPLPAMRMPARTAITKTPLGRPGSSKGVDSQNARTPGISPRLSYATPAINTTPVEHHGQASTRLGGHGDLFDHRGADGDSDMLTPSLVDLSPNTVASNNAPSLVSDDGEYDEGDDDAESSASEDEEEGSDVAEIDIEDGEGEKEVPRTVLRNRSGGGAQGMRLRKEDKHVTFVSPVKETRSRK